MKPHIFLLSSLFIFGCDQTIADNEIAMTVDEENCVTFYDEEESGFTTRCIDPENIQCHTLYEPDGDTEYYCGGVKMWEIEPDDIAKAVVGATIGATIGKKVTSTTKPTTTTTKTVTSTTKPTTTTKTVTSTSKRSSSKTVTSTSKRSGSKKRK